MARVNFKMSIVTSNGTQEAVYNPLGIWGLGDERPKYIINFTQLGFSLHIISIKYSPSPFPVDINEM